MYGTTCSILCIGQFACVSQHLAFAVLRRGDERHIGRHDYRHLEGKNLQGLGD